MLQPKRLPTACVCRHGSEQAGEGSLVLLLHGPQEVSKGVMEISLWITACSTELANP